jgi:putative SOS response-associated peptidase YedK
LTEDEIIEIRAIIQNISLRLLRDDIGSFYTHKTEVYPTDKAPVITKESDGIAFENAKFGFKKWDGKGVIINARSETIESKKMFSKLLTVGRCVVPANEYYEWQEQDHNGTAKGKAKKKKHYVKDKEGNLLFFAGLYKDGDDGREFVIITKDAIGDVAKIHDRMPVVLRADQIELWLNGNLSPSEITKMDFNAAVEPCVDASK